MLFFYFIMAYFIFHCNNARHYFQNDPPSPAVVNDEFLSKINYIEWLTLISKEDRHEPKNNTVLNFLLWINNVLLTYLKLFCKI